MKYSARYLSFCILLFLLNSCKKESIEIKTTVENSTYASQIIQINNSLDSLAKIIAQTVDDTMVRTIIHQEINKQFDGDYNVLWKTIKSVQENNLTFEDLIYHSYCKKKSNKHLSTQEQLTQLTTTIPKLQIAMPANFQNWDAINYTPLVAYVPFGVQENSYSQLTAYDKDGNIYYLDASLPPSEPVIVLGVNERTDDNGNVIYAVFNTNLVEDTSKNKSQTATEDVMLKRVCLYNLHESWARGRAEIGVQIKEYHEDNDRNYTYSGAHAEIQRDEVGQWIGVFSELYPNYNSTSEYQVFFWQENDGGLGGSYIWDAVYYNGRFYYFSRSSGDDYVGCNIIYNSSITASTYSNPLFVTVETGDLRYSIYANR